LAVVSGDSRSRTVEGSPWHQDETTACALGSIVTGNMKLWAFICQQPVAVDGGPPPCLIIFLTAEVGPVGVNHAQILISNF